MRRDGSEGPELPRGRRQPEKEEPGFLWPPTAGELALCVLLFILFFAFSWSVQRQLLLLACCLTEKCYRNFSTWGPLQPALIPVFHGSPAWVHRPQRRPAF